MARYRAVRLWGSPDGPFPPPARRTGHADLPASGSRTKHHAFAHGAPRPSWVSRTSPLPRCSRRAPTSLKLARLYQPSPKWVSGRSAHRPFPGLLSVHSCCGLHTRTVTYVTVIRRLQTLRHLDACPGCFRLEHLAGWDLHPLESAAFARAPHFRSFTPPPALPNFRHSLMSIGRPV